ncbi:MAG: response regulator [Bacteroidales bacterium]|nr:response regulator [Bacteroidales bacterium]
MMTNKEDVKILLVDDSPSNNLLLQNILEEEGYAPITSFDGKNALEIIRKEKPDLVLLDIMMPEIDGFEVLEEIVTNDDTKDIKVIVITARKDPEDRNRAIDLGVIDYIIKPIDIDYLLKRIEYVVQKL